MLRISTALPVLQLKDGDYICDLEMAFLPELVSSEILWVAEQAHGDNAR